jgi:hypothetical protein
MLGHIREPVVATMSVTVRGCLQTACKIRSRIGSPSILNRVAICSSSPAVTVFVNFPFDILLFSYIIIT